MGERGDRRETWTDAWVKPCAQVLLEVATSLSSWWEDLGVIPGEVEDYQRPAVGSDVSSPPPGEWCVLLEYLAYELMPLAQCTKSK